MAKQISKKQIKKNRQQERQKKITLGISKEISCSLMIANLIGTICRSTATTLPRMSNGHTAQRLCLLRQSRIPSSTTRYGKSMFLF